MKRGFGNVRRTNISSLAYGELHIRAFGWCTAHRDLDFFAPYKYTYLLTYLLTNFDDLLYDLKRP